MPRDYSEWGPSFPPSIPKLPPPEHGIRVKHIGATWWGERWVAALLRFGRRYAARLERGRGYARQGRVHDLAVRGSTVTASVTGSRPTPYRVTVTLRPLPGAVWERALAAMAAKARFAAALLAGEMPRDIDAAFAAGRGSLFPARPAELRARCSCPDDANPCKHIAAVHYVLAEAFDRDPFLLFELRGRPREAVLAHAQSLGHGDGRGQRDGAAPKGVKLGKIDASAYDRFGRPIDDLHFRISAPSGSGALLRQLGAAPGWSLPESLEDLLQPVVARVAARAREMALESPIGEERRGG